MAALNPKQERFVAEYLIDCNASAAALRAGYKSGDVGRQLLTKTHVREAIAAGKARLAGKLELKAENVLREYLLLAFSDIGQVLDFSRTDPTLRPANEIPEAARRAIASVKVRRHTEGHGDDAREVEVTEFRLWDKLNALEKLAKHLGLLKEKLEVTGRDGEPAFPPLEKIVAALAAAEGKRERGGGTAPAG